MFGEFNQVEDAQNRQFEGTGLGLAISQQLIHMMGGNIWVESLEGQGSTFGFKITLPLADGAPQEVPTPPKGVSCAMVVDAQDANRVILAKQLSLMGVETVECHSGAEALAQITPEIDLVLTDHNMAEMDGLELAEALREAGHDVPIVLLSGNTGYAEQDPARRFLAAMLQKPVPRSDLFNMLADLGGSAPAPTVIAPEPAPQVVSHARALRVLAAEDNKTNQLVFSKMVKTLDIDLQFAANGIEAVEMYESFDPDIVFMDISMPKMDGKEATRSIRKIEEGTGRHVPVVAMTAHAMEGDDKGILAAGLDHYLTKPLRKAAIHEQIENACPQDVRPPLAPVAEAG